MAKKTKATKPAAPALAPSTVKLEKAMEKVVAALTPAAPVATGKLTKRNQTPTTATLVATAKPNRSRAPHVVDAWAAVTKALPNTAAELAKLGPLAHPQCVSPAAFISYMLRRGYLAVKN